MTDRSAIDTLRGYFYQFDFSIATLLAVNDEDEITIEGIEDVDVKNSKEESAVQCKYYAKTEYNHSVIAEPIRWMLSHFREVKDGKKTPLKYILRGFYKSGQEKLTLPIDVEFLKNVFLTYTRTKSIEGIPTKVKHHHHNELGLDDNDLHEFLTYLEIDINAKEFEKQYDDILIEMKNLFGGSIFEAEYFYYNNALGVIRKISKNPDVNKRRITKKEFVTKINTKRILFNEWFIQANGLKIHFQNLRKEYFSSLNTLYKERFFLVEMRKDVDVRVDIKDLIMLLIKNYTKIINQPTPFCPYIHINGIASSELIELKKDIISENILISDGFEFEGADFSPNAILRKPNSNHQVKIKILNRLAELENTLAICARRSEIYQFYLKEPFFEFDNPSVKHIKIQIQELKNLKAII